MDLAFLPDTLQLTMLSCVFSSPPVEFRAKCMACSRLQLYGKLAAEFTRGPPWKMSVPRVTAL
jgi:hypothetical protein